MQVALPFSASGFGLSSLDSYHTWQTTTSTTPRSFPVAEFKTAIPQLSLRSPRSPHTLATNFLGSFGTSVGALPRPSALAYDGGGCVASVCTHC
jgi:hypothetical protein